jgi:hypothetical protein
MSDDKKTQLSEQLEWLKELISEELANR